MQRRPGFGLIASVLLLTGLQGAASPQPPRGYVSTYVWQMDDPAFGGFSAIELAPDGGAFVALTDRGFWASGTLQRDEAGRISGVQAGALTAIPDVRGGRVLDIRRDAEGLAIAPDGTRFVAFERSHRVQQHAADGAALRVLPTFEAFPDYPANNSLEAMALDDLGRLFIIPEGRETDAGPVPVFRFDGAWQVAFHIPRQGSFVPVGADFGPDGRLYLLERKFQGMSGFASRVRAMELPPDGATARPQTILESSAGLHDNLEGIALWRDPAGGIRLTMISDDNQFALQQTEIVEYRLPALNAD